MRIESVVAHEVAMPLVRPFRTSFGVETTRHVILLEVTTDEGVGWGECVSSENPLYSHEFNAAALLVLRDHIIPRVLGRDLEQRHRRDGGRSLSRPGDRPDLFS